MTTGDPIGLTLVRHFAAPCALVFRMYSEPEHMRAWFGPKDMAIPALSLDFPARAWFAEFRSASRSTYRMHGVYREILENARIVFTHSAIDEDASPGSRPSSR